MSTERDSNPDFTQFVWPKTGQAAIGSRQHGVIACSSNVKVAPMASMTKLILAVAALEKGQRLARKYTLTAERDRTILPQYVERQGVVVPLATDAVITLVDGIWLAINSVSNLTHQFAEAVFGSVHGYRAYAGTMLKRMGVRRTVVADACGFDAAAVSNPTDLVSFFVAVLEEHPTMIQIMRQRRRSLPGIGAIPNRNFMLDDGLIGKTGFTDASGRCYVFVVEGQDIVGAVQGVAGDPAELRDVTLRLVKSAQGVWRA